MHFAENMIGARTANYHVSLFKRYFHMSKHRKPGQITITTLGLIIALELRLGVAHA